MSIPLLALDWSGGWSIKWPETSQWLPLDGHLKDLMEFHYHTFTKAQEKNQSLPEASRNLFSLTGLLPNRTMCIRGKP